MAVSIWQVLTAIAPILAPIIALVITVLGKIIWNHENRLTDLERGNTRQSRTLYGDEDDAQQDGLSKNVNEISERLTKLEQTIGELRDEVEELNEK